MSEWGRKEHTSQSHNFGFVKVMLMSKGIRSHVSIRWCNINKSVDGIAAMSRTNILLRHLLCGFNAAGKQSSSSYWQEPGSRTKCLVSAFNVQCSVWSMSKGSVKTPLLQQLLLVCHWKVSNSAPWGQPKYWHIGKHFLLSKCFRGFVRSPNKKKNEEEQKRKVSTLLHFVTVLSPQHIFTSYLLH